jgi:hypothetical protein
VQITAKWWLFFLIDETGEHQSSANNRQVASVLLVDETGVCQSAANY